ncbi:hypothetical protein M422DRAFT_160335, partial [Sphaerobolus stellatus SS14]
GVDIEARGEKFGTALQCASFWARKDAVEILLQCGADVNADGGTCGSPLINVLGWRDGALAMVQTLLEKGANANARFTGEDGSGSETALSTACRHGYQEIIKLLIENGADVNSFDVLLASASRNSSILQMILDYGADPNILQLADDSRKFATVLQYAFLCSMESVVQLLLERGADANIQGGQYETALQAAVVSWAGEAFAVVAILLDHGVDIKI